MAESRASTAARDVWLRFVARELAGERAEFAELCAAHADLAGELRHLRDGWLAADGSVTPPAAPAAPASLEGLMRRLGEPAPRAARYRIDGEIARGGMGVVLRVFDPDLQRHLALKVLRAPPGAGSQHALARFVEEAQIAAQLDHPAIVPIHDVGIDELGRPFFVMKLVEGRDLRRVFEQVWNGEDGWNATRAVGVLLKVCEAAGYAHEKGVIHRDLKPSNVMVGRYGEVYVMDWGVARVLGAAARVPDTGASGVRPVSTLRSDAARDDTDSALLTAAGDVIGTAAYMSPEQALGENERLTPRSDVYSVGAMLYHLLARRAPYASEGSTSAEVLARVRAGPPPPLARAEVRADPELVAICERAMAREPERRYADLSELAGDLRAYLEGRVVRAHRTGAWVAARKWTRRNRALSASVAGLLAIVVAGAWIARRAAVVRANFELLARLQQPTELLVEYELLWPATEARLPALERWLGRAEAVASHVGEYRAQLAELRRAAEAWDSAAPAERIAERDLEVRRRRARRLIQYLEDEREELWRTGAPATADGMTLAEVEEQLARDRPTMIARDAQRIERETWTFADAETQLLHDRLAALIPDLERLTSADAGFSPIERVRRAIGLVCASRARTEVSSAAAWADAIASICDASQCPGYGGLVIEPQEGLVPIGRDPGSGLWEFAHVPSGEPARRGADGHLELCEATGIVLVLLPGGEYLQGSQDESAARAYFDPDHQDVEAPQTLVVLDPFFLSKFEMTQAQWRRWTGENPSQSTAEIAPDVWFSALQPVETVRWKRCVDVLRELGLALPFEAQWEYAARGGTDSPWSHSGGVAELALYANLLDPTHADRDGARNGELHPALARDGFCATAPVGSLAPNPFGLHDVHGNVAEWCADLGPLPYSQPRWLGTGARAIHSGDEGGRVCRGGGFVSSPREARSAARRFAGVNAAGVDLGLRPARALDP